VEAPKPAAGWSLDSDETEPVHGDSIPHAGGLPATEVLDASPEGLMPNAAGFLVRSPGSKTGSFSMRRSAIEQ
jgi:hypothetical protein